MEMEGKEVKAEAPGKRGRQEESMEMEGKEVKAEMAEKEKKKKRMIGMENRGYGRMGMKNGEWKKILSLALAGTMTASLIACGSGTNGADAGEGGTDGIEKARTAEAGNGGAQETENAETQEVLAQVLGSQAKTTHSSETGKEETVYVLADAKGDVNKVIVSNWVKNGNGSSSLSDVSLLEGIENVKGYESYTAGQDGSLVWDAGGADIYYQGTTDKELPVDVRISYTLDGKEIAPEELAGKTGKVTIRFDYENKQKETVDINGSEEEIYVPFAMISGMVLPSDTFSNVEVTNGKLISEGNSYLVVGVAFPGLRDSLNIDELKEEIKDEEKREEIDDLNIPDYLEVSADAVDFNLSMTMTMAMSDVLSDIDLTDSIDVDDINESMDDLESATEELIDGTSKLKDGTGELRDGAKELKDGTTELRDGVQELKDGTTELRDGTVELKDGTEKLLDGAGKLKDGTETLKDGTGTLKEGADTLKAGTQELSEKSKVLDAGAGQLDGGVGELTAGSRKLAEGTMALASGSQALDAGAARIQQGLASVDTAIGAMVGACQGTEGQIGLVGASQSLSQGMEGLDALLEQYFSTYENTLDETINRLQQTAAAAAEEEIRARAALAQAIERQQAAEAALSAACEPELKTVDVEVEAEGKMAQATVSGLVTGYSVEPITTTVQAMVESVSADEVSKAAADYRNAGEAVAQAQADVAAAQAKAQTAQEAITQLAQQYGASGEFANAGDATQAAYITYIKTASANLKAGSKQLEAGVNALYQGLLQLDDAQAGVPALAAGAEQLKAGTEAAVAGTKELGDGAAALNQGADALKMGTTELKDGTGKLIEGTEKLDTGAATLKDGAVKLDDGAKELKDGAKELGDGAGELDEGAGKLQDGTVELDDGVQELKDGAEELDDGVVELVDGTIELDDGALELKDGMIEFNEEGISKLTDLFGDNVQKVIDRIDALKSIGSGYNTFSGLQEGTEGSVRFIYKTDGVKAE